MIIFRKSHPVTQAMSGAAKPVDLVDGETRRNPGEPSPEQAEADAYKKPRIEWRGLTIAIENPAGSVRRGTNRHGVSWEIRMRFDYGEVLGSMGVDGDPVDIYMGPNLEAPMVYVVHQRKVGRWDEYDEDKCMVGFDCQADAEAAFLSNYNDPRFLGPVTAMPVDEFAAKVRATRDKPAMIKAHGPVVLFFKAHVGAYLRGGKLVNVTGYQGRNAHAVAGPGQMSLFGGPESGKPLPPSPLQGKDAVAHTPDMFEPQQKSASPIHEWVDREKAPVGSWVKADYKLADSQPVYQVINLNLDGLYLPELDSDGRLQPEKRKYLDGYTERAKAGEQAPSISVIEMENGKMRVVDGHRRVMAARAAGKLSIRALVSPLIDTPDGKKEATAEMVGAQDDLLTGIPGAKFNRGKGRIAGHYGVDVGGEMMSNYHADPVHAVAEAKQWIANRADNERNKAARSAAVGNMRDRLMAGGDVTDSDLKLLGLKDGSSGLKWFIPAAAEVFGITSHAVRPHIKAVIRTGTTDMGTKLEFVDPKKAMAAIAAGLAPKDAQPKILFTKTASSSNLSNNEPVANKQELKMEAKTVDQLTAELKAAEAVMDAEMKGAGKFIQSDKVMNEGGGGYSRSEDLSESAYNRNMPKIKAAKQALFAAVWTPEVTALRRAAWNAEAASMRTTAQVLKLQSKLGFTGAELKSAIALNEGK
jgi:hypothetical protein